MKNTLYYGDNLDILRRYIPNDFADLVYLDPPFNSNADYNVLFAEHSGVAAAAQIKAFEDTWTWDTEAAQSYEKVAEQGGAISEALQACRQMLGTSNMMAYLAMMAPRLIEMHRALKATGSLYLHCDPTASHYLKVLLDAIFSPRNFRNEIVWQRHNARSTTGRWPRMHDTLLFYTKGPDFYFESVEIPAEGPVPHTLITVGGEKYQTYEMTAPGLTKDGDSGKPWRGFDVSSLGRHWANTHSIMDAWDEAGLIHWPARARKGGWPRRRDESPFIPAARVTVVGDVWTDIDRINQSAKERLGYPTQKPEALLHRIIEASCPPGGTVLDPFCGCGTTISVAQRLARPWVGIDITHLAVGLIKHRLADQFGSAIALTYRVVGEPTTLPDAEQLAREDKYQFQFWALGLVHARPAASQEKKGADKGIDGNLYFHDDPKGKTKRIILSVKGGDNITASMIRDLAGTVAREKADVGVLITLRPPTAPMRKDAASHGFYTSPMGGKHQRIQILTIEQLLDGAAIDYPSAAQRADLTFKKARRSEVRLDQLPLSALPGDASQDSFLEED